MVEKVQKFKTTDGELFDNEKEAKGHQKDVDLKKGLEFIVSQFFYRGIENRYIVDGLIENIDRLRDLLKSTSK